VEAIATGMERVLDDRELRTTLIAAGRERSREFQWRRTAVETLQVLERAAPERRAAGELVQGRAR